ncbi:hypothetical protein BC835DRAFT_1268627 [Cytidiella melzeri]|nr:hypothetical protein BC835DRAFT_1268627 [Cytidiella melzeri]
MSAPRPVIVITGANSGVGFGTCERLLLQLCEKVPKDALPQFKPISPSSSPDVTPEDYDGLTLILACRSKERALEARAKLLLTVDRQVAKQKQRRDYDGRAERFRENLEINFHKVDMADVQSVFEFAEELSGRYTYVSHLICNAGAAFFGLVDVLGAMRSIIKNGISVSITIPSYKLQPTGRMGKDGLGAIWHCNLFGHYVLYRHLYPLFKAYAQKFERPARVLWTSSLEGQPCWYDHEDWQLLKTDHAYEGSKYEIDLVASELQRRSLRSDEGGKVVRHFIVHPGVVWSNMSNEMIWSFLNVAIGIVFYIGRLFGSPNHPVTAVKGAMSATYCALASLAIIPTSLLGFSHIQSSKTPPSSLWEDSLPNMTLYERGLESAEAVKAAELRGEFVPLKFGVETDRLGREHVGVIPVVEWEEHRKEAEFLLEKCESLYTSFTALHKSSGQAGSVAA